MHLICLDIGNTRLKVGIFHPQKEAEFIVFPNYDLETFHSLTKKYPTHQFVCSNTALLSTTIDSFLKQTSNFLEINHQIDFPFDNLYETPHTLGTDRMALVAGAISLYPNKNCLIIDAGTSITLDFINQNGEYLGGSIHPGIEMRLKALYNFTGKLPLVKDDWRENLIGKSTNECIQIGTVKAAVYEIEQFISEYRENFEDLVVLLSGGNTEIFFYKLKNEIFAHPNLVLLGLKTIALYNAK
ncbi:MAG TPA: type III pantothenate kinase [Chitinophagales bacterium]|nr:type III pantothenate kinase [Chitinophagales bacterium]